MDPLLPGVLCSGRYASYWNAFLLHIFLYFADEGWEKGWVGHDRGWLGISTDGNVHNSQQINKPASLLPPANEVSEGYVFTCVEGRIHGRKHTRLRHVWRGGGEGELRGRRNDHCSGRYGSFWNASYCPRTNCILINS